MKKTFFWIYVIAIVFAVVSCAGPKGDSGPTGPSGASGTMFVKEFQYGIEPYAGYNTATDATVNDGAQANNYGACNYNTVGHMTFSYRTVFYFPVSGISPTNVKVSHAYLTLYPEYVLNSVTITAYSLNTLYIEGNAGCAGANNGSVNWGYTTDGNYNPTPISSSFNRTGDDADALYPLVLELNKATVESWISAPDSNKGMVLKGSNEVSNAYINFRSKENTVDARYNPKLTIYYEIP